MLVLSRRIDEEIVVGGPCTIVVVEVVGNYVRLGVTAERSVPVRRGELKPLAEDPAHGHQTD